MVRQEHPSSSSGLIVPLACFVDLRLMTVATRWAPQPLDPPVNVITNSLLCHLSSLSFYLPMQCCTLGIIDLLARKQTANCVNGVSSLACLEIIYQSKFIMFAVSCQCCTSFGSKKERQECRITPYFMPHNPVEGFQSGSRRIINPKKHKTHHWSPSLLHAYAQFTYLKCITLFSISLSGWESSSAFHLP